MTTRRQFLNEALALAAVGSVKGAAAAPAPPPAPEITDSDVGSLFPFIQSQAVKGEFPLSFLQPEFTDLAAWKQRARGRVFELLHYAPPAVDPRPQTLARVDRGDYVEEAVLFNTTPDVRVPAAVLVPKGRTGRGPALVALHDHGGFYFWGREKLLERDDEHPVLTDFKRQYYGGRSIASDLARRGYVVVVIDMFYWGERRLVLANDPADWRDRPGTITPERIAAFNRRASENEQLTARTIYAAGFTWSGVMYWDDIRTVDYLLTRPEVDPNRIGCLGLSIGGLRTIHLSALDERIKAGVAVGWMTSFRPQLARHIRNTIGFTKLVPGLYKQLDYPDVASLAAPRPLLVINGSKDALFEPGAVQAAFQKLQACWRKAGAPDNIRTRLYDTPHEFNREMQAEAWGFLDAHLR
jgi:dienelactone hydrolase